MSNPAQRIVIKNEIADLIKAHPPGLGEQALIQQVESTPSAKLIIDCLDQMKEAGHIVVKFRRCEMTAKGRAHYSDLNTDNKQSQQAPPKRNPPPLANENKPAPLPADETKIKPVPCFETPDGILHRSEQDAQNHLITVQINRDIDAFIDTGASDIYPPEKVRTIINQFKRWEMERTA